MAAQIHAAVVLQQELSKSSLFEDRSLMADLCPPLFVIICQKQYKRHMKRVIKLSVGDLLWPERRSELRQTVWLQRAAMGRSAHEMHTDKQIASIEGYKKEIKVEHVIETGKYKVFIGGRIDGGWLEKSKWIIEEIKSIVPSSPPIPASAHQMQCAIYMWMWSQKESVDHGVLTLIDPIQSRTIQHTFYPDLSEIEATVTNRIQQVLEWKISEVKRIQKRKRHCHQITWPYPEYRKGQREIIESVENSVSSGRNLLIEAPTGSGKTAPILLTTFKETVKNGNILAYATSRTSQQEDRVKLIEESIPESARGIVLVISAQDSLCPDHESTCLPVPFRTESFLQFDPPEWFLNEIHSGKILTRPVILELAERYNICPILLQREILLRADVLIGDQYILADPDLNLYNWTKTLQPGRRTTLLIDEAHGLPERLRNRKTIRISLKSLKYICKHLSRSPSLLSRELVSNLKEVQDRIERLLQSDEYGRGDYEIIPVILDEMRVPLGNSATLAGILGIEDRTLSDSSLMKSLSLIDNVYSHPQGWEAYLDRIEGAIGWELLDTGDQLRRIWQRSSTSIAFSATLSPIHYFFEQFGMTSEDTDYFTSGDLFDQNQRWVGILQSINTSYEMRNVFHSELSALLQKLPDVTGGKWMVFFPSYAYLNEIEMQLTINGVQSTAYRNSEGLGPKLDSLQKGRETSLHLMVMSGAFAEGFEWKDTEFDGIVIVGPGIPPPSIRKELLRMVYDSEEEPGYIKAYVLPAVIKVVQAAGRLIRSENQRGAIILVGERFTKPYYSNLLPAYMREAFAFTTDAELLESLQKWWRR